MAITSNGGAATAETIVETYDFAADGSSNSVTFADCFTAGKNYLLRIRKVLIATGTNPYRLQFGVSGTPNTSSKYASTCDLIESGGTARDFNNLTGSSSINLTNNLGVGGQSVFGDSYIDVLILDPAAGEGNSINLSVSNGQFKWLDQSTAPARSYKLDGSYTFLRTSPDDITPTDLVFLSGSATEFVEGTITLIELDS